MQNYFVVISYYYVIKIYTNDLSWYNRKNAVVNIIEKVVEGDASNASVKDTDEGTKDFTWFRWITIRANLSDISRFRSLINFTYVIGRYLKKRSLGMESEKVRISKNTLEDIMGNGANGYLARGCALRNVTGILYKNFEFMQR